MKKYTPYVKSGSRVKRKSRCIDKCDKSHVHTPASVMRNSSNYRCAGALGDLLPLLVGLLRFGAGGDHHIEILQHIAELAQDRLTVALAQHLRTLHVDQVLQLSGGLFNSRPGLVVQQCGILDIGDAPVELISERSHDLLGIIGDVTPLREGCRLRHHLADLLRQKLAPFAQEVQLLVAQLLAHQLHHRTSFLPTVVGREVGDSMAELLGVGFAGQIPNDQPTQDARLQLLGKVPSQPVEGKLGCTKGPSLIPLHTILLVVVFTHDS